jgi:hypothetical protein
MQGVGCSIAIAFFAAFMCMVDWNHMLNYSSRVNPALKSAFPKDLSMKPMSRAVSKKAEGTNPSQMNVQAVEDRGDTDVSQVTVGMIEKHSAKFSSISSTKTSFEWRETRSVVLKTNDLTPGQSKYEDSYKKSRMRLKDKDDKGGFTSIKLTGKCMLETPDANTALVTDDETKDCDGTFPCILYEDGVEIWCTYKPPADQKDFTDPTKWTATIQFLPTAKAVAIA